MGVVRRPSSPSAWSDSSANSATLRSANTAGLACQLHGKTRWRTDRGHDRNASHCRLLHELEAHAAADDEYALTRGQIAGELLGPDDFVERIVSAHVLADRSEAAVEVKQGR